MILPYLGNFLANQLTRVFLIAATSPLRKFSPGFNTQCPSGWLGPDAWPEGEYHELPVEEAQAEGLPGGWLVAV